MTESLFLAKTDAVTAEAAAEFKVTLTAVEAKRNSPDADANAVLFQKPVRELDAQGLELLIAVFWKAR